MLERHRERKRESQRSFAYWFILQMASTAGARYGQIRATKSVWNCYTDGKDPTTSAVTAALQVHVSRKMDCKWDWESSLGPLKWKGGIPRTA